jgi:hypothetical protein
VYSVKTPSTLVVVADYERGRIGGCAFKRYFSRSPITKDSAKHAIVVTEGAQFFTTEIQHNDGAIGDSAWDAPSSPLPRGRA